MKLNGEEVDSSPFEGTVSINLETFGDIYLTVMGLKEDTGYLGIDASHRMRVKALQDGRIQFSFTNYKDVQRTLFHLTGWKLVLTQAVFEMLKRKVPIIKFHHSESEGLTVSTSYDRENSTLTISHEYGKIDLVDKSVFAVKQMLENYLFYGRETTREFRVGPSGLFTLKTDGTLYIAGRDVSKKTISIPLCGTMKEVRAYPIMLWKTVS